MGRRAASAIFVGCLVLFFGTRILLVAQAPTRLYHPEEYVNLRLAASLLGEDGDWGRLTPPKYRPLQSGSPMGLAPLSAFQYQTFDGGTLAASMLLVPIAAVFGLSTTSVKIGALLWTALGLLLWLEVLGHALGPRARIWGAAAFALAPAPFLITSSVHWGNHAESAFGPPLILLAGLAARRSLGALRPAMFLLLGAAAGFSVWFSQLNLLPGGVALLAGLVVARARVWHLPLVVLGGVLGLTPRLLLMPPKDLFRFGAQQKGVGDLVDQLLHGAWTHVELKAMWRTHPSLATWDLEGLGSLGFAEPAEAWLRGVLVLAALAALWGTRSRRPGWTLAAGAVVVAVVTWFAQPALLLASQELMPRRVSNLYPLACAVVALGCASLGRWKPRLGGILLLAWAAPNLLGQAALLGSAQPPESDLTPWAWYAPPENHLHWRTNAGLPSIDADLVDELEDALQQCFDLGGDRSQAAARGLYQAFGQTETVLQRRALACERPPGPLPPDALGAWGYGRGLRIRCRDASTSPDWCPGDDPVLAEACLRGQSGAPPPGSRPRIQDSDHP